MRPILVGASLLYALTVAPSALSAQQPGTSLGGCLDPDRPTPAHACNDRLDDYIRSQMREMNIPGLSVAVVQRGTVVKARGYGLANVETSTPATEQTVYKSASLCKQFIGAAIMLLVQEGKVRLDDRAAIYLDGSPEQWRDITVRQLLTHTSGLVRSFPNFDPNREQPIASVIATAYQVPLRSAPGAKWAYSNVGYYILAEIINKTSGTSWDAFIAERLFVPAGMRTMRPTTFAELVPNRARGYAIDRSSKRMINAEDWMAVQPSGAFLSTVLDMAKWDIFLDRKNPIVDTLRTQMWTQVTLTDGSHANYGYGWIVDSILGRTRLHHDGQYPGFRSDYERFPDDHLSVIVLANFDHPGVESLAMKIAGFYAPTLAGPPFTLRATASRPNVPRGQPVSLTFDARDDGKPAPVSVMELAVRDARDSVVYSERKPNQHFLSGETKTQTVSWQPTTPGTYSVDVAVYGPKAVPLYARRVKAVTFIAE
jgi:CubicO group peptidase (beta-lactamase class C family)